MNAIELKGLKKSFPDFTLGPVDLAVPEGTILGLIGENGAVCCARTAAASRSSVRTRRSSTRTRSASCSTSLAFRRC